MNTRIVVHPPKMDDKKQYYVTVSYYVNGKRRQRRKSGFDKSRDAKKAGEAIKKKLEAEMPTIIMTGGESPTLRQFVEQYNRIRGDTWSAGTKKSRANSMRRCDFMDKPLDDITKMDIEINIAKLKPLYKHNTLKSTLAAWMVYLNAAREYGYIGSAPRIRLDAPKEDKKIKALSIEKAWELYEKLEDQEVKLLCLLGLTTGLRLGELLDLSDADIDYDKGTLTVSHQWAANRVPGLRNAPLKTRNSYRTVPLSQRTLDALRAYPVRTVSGHIFPRPGALGSRVWRAFKRTGIDATAHTLRHTYITGLIRSGKFDIQSVAALAGDTIETVLKTYAHYLEESAEENREKIRELFL